MHRYLILFIAPALLLSCDMKRKDRIADDSAKTKAELQMAEEALHDSTTVQIIDSAYNFGKATDGEKVEYSYRFKNTGSKPLVVTNASASCGCTVPEKPEKPILPGETGFIKVVFNSAGRVGEAHKTITVTSNAYPGFPTLQLTGEVIAKKDAN